MFDYRQLQALATVVEEQNFERAAQRLHVTQSAISQRIKQLEELVGQTLLIRTHPLQATDAGQVLLKHYRQIAMLQSAVMSELNPVLETGQIRLSIGLNADTLATWFLPAIEPLLNAHSVLLDIKVDDQDQTQQLLRSGEVMGCISSSDKPLQGCHCIPLGVSVYRLLASPQFMKKYLPEGANQATLRRAPVVEFNHKDALQIRYLEQFFDLRPGDYACHRIPSAETFIDLIVRGFGMGMIPDQMTTELLSSGQLVDVSPGDYLAVPLYWHVWNLKAPLAEELTHALAEQGKKDLAPFSDYPILATPKLTR